MVCSVASVEDVTVGLFHLVDVELSRVRLFAVLLKAQIFFCVLALIQDNTAVGIGVCVSVLLLSAE